MATTLKTTKRKSLEQQIADTREKLKKLEAEKSKKGLESTSPRMTELLAEIEKVTKLNKCKVIDVIRSINRIKKVGADIQVKARAPRKPSTKKAETEKK